MVAITDRMSLIMNGVRAINDPRPRCNIGIPAQNSVGNYLQERNPSHHRL
jgi:hypothetical protein